MKIKIDSKKLKNNVERAIVICDKKSDCNIEILTANLINPILKGIVIRTANLSENIEIFDESVTVYEEGSIYVSYNDFKKIYNMTGELTIISKDNNIEITNGKKTSKIKNPNYLQKTKIDNSDYFAKGLHILTANRNEFIDVILNLLPFTEQKNDFSIFSGINFNLEDGIICSTNTHCLTAYNLNNNEWDIYNKCVFTINKKNIEKIKKIMTKNKDKTLKEMTVSLFILNNDILILGEDFNYVFELLQGNFPNLQNILKDKQKCTCHYIVDIAELKEIAKEYKEINKQNLDNLMIMTIKNNNLVTCTGSLNYITKDNIKIKNYNGNNNEDLIVVNPDYIYEAANLFSTKYKESFIDIDFIDKKHGIYFSHDNYINIVCPIILTEILTENNINYIKDFIYNE